MTDEGVVVVANPTAGRGKAGRLIGRADARLKALRIDHRVLVAGSARDMESMCRAAAEGGAAVVAVIGGDGTVSCAANGLLGSDAALAVLPGGTGDDFASVIGVRRFDAAVGLLANPKTVAIDVVRVTTGAVVRHFVNVAGAGFDSDVNETADGMTVKVGSTGTYIAAMVKTLSRFSPAHYEVQIDDRPLSVDAMLTVVGNGRSYGGGMKVLPQASLVDGRVDVCIVEALSKAAFLRAFPRVFTGSLARHPKVQMHTGSRVSVEANRKIQVYADGERIGPLPAVFETVPGALPVVVGPDAMGIP
jgi:diacylglycerol kinase (ATP)